MHLAARKLAALTATDLILAAALSAPLSAQGHGAAGFAATVALVVSVTRVRFVGRIAVWTKK